MTIAPQLAQIRVELNDSFYEREEAIEALFLGALTRQHVFILGLPGTGKSLLTRAFVSRFPGASYFEQLLSKNRPDSAVLGPYDLPLLRDKGEFRRKDAGYLTSCDFAFLDEVGKASPTLGHDLLAALNERIKHEVTADRAAVPIPLHSCFTASNELPASESEDEAALWDRLLIRCVVDYIDHDGSFKALMERSDAPGKATLVPFADLQAAAETVQRVVLLDDVLNAVIRLRRELRADGITVSDRRWRESMKVVRATAYLAGRDVAEIQDLTALRFTLWEDLEQRKKIERKILSIASPDEEEVAVLMDAVNEVLTAVRAKAGESDEKLFQFGPEAFGKAKAIRKQARALQAKLTASGRPVTSVEKVLAGAGAIEKETKKLLRLPDGEDD